MLHQQGFYEDDDLRLWVELDLGEEAKRPKCEEGRDVVGNLANVLLGECGRVATARDLVETRMPPGPWAVDGWRLLHRR